MSRQYILAVDPGWTGACALVSTDLKEVKTLKSHPSPQQFLEFTTGKDIVEAWEEEVSGLPGDTPHTAFKLGASFGIWQTLLSCVCSEVLFIRPKTWQTRFCRMMTDGAVRYCPKDRSERKKFIQEQAEKVAPCYLYAADAVAIGIYAANTYGDNRDEFKRA
jgi:hypothetical protein